MGILGDVTKCFRQHYIILARNLQFVTKYKENINMSRSLVWQYFDVWLVTTLLCKECKKEIKRETENTSNLRR